MAFRVLGGSSFARVVLAIAASTWIVSTRPARAQPASEPARRIAAFVDSADFETAEKEAARALESGSLSRPALARVYLELGVVGSARGDVEAASTAFRKALTLDSTLALRSSAGPHVSALFGRARRATLAMQPMTVRAQLARSGNDQMIVTVRVTGDTEGLARGVVVEAEGMRARHPLDASGSSIVEPLGGKLQHCSVVSVGIVDDHGNSVWPNVVHQNFCPKPASSRTIAADEAPPIRGTGATPSKSEHPTPVYVWVGAGISGALAVATAALGVVALDHRADYHAKNNDDDASVVERRKLRQNAERAEKSATIAAIATGIVGSATLVLYLTRQTSETRVRVALSARHIDLGCEF